MKIFLGMFFAVIAVAQNQGPVIFGVEGVDGQHGAVVPGSVMTIRGANFSASAVVPTTLAWPASLNSIQVYVDGLSAAVGYADNGQVNIQVPTTLPVVGQHTVQVVRLDPNSGLGFVSKQFPVRGAAIDVALYRIGGNPASDAIVQNVDYTLNSVNNPSVPSGGIARLTVYGTGLLMGATLPTGQASPSALNLDSSIQGSVVIDGQQTYGFTYMGAAPTRIGTLQFNFSVPVAEVAATANGKHTAYLQFIRGSEISTSAPFPVYLGR